MITCPKCSKENQDHYKFCLGCGAELPRDAAPKPFASQPPPHGMRAVQQPVPPSVAVPAAVPRPAQAPAPAAYQPVPAAAAYPPSPPASAFPATPPAPPAAPAAAATAACPQCGHPNYPQNKFCAACGYNLHAAAAAPAAPAAAAPAYAAPVAAAAAPSLQVLLTALRADGSEAGTYTLPGATVTVGRDIGGIFAGDSYLSPRHATFSIRSGKLYVKDEASLNGVYVKLQQGTPVALQPADLFRIGQEIIRYEALAPQPASPDGVERLGSPSKGYVGRISLMTGRDTTGNAFPIPEAGIHIGRERGDVLFPEDGYVSGLHCRVTWESGSAWLTDLGSSNGTFLRLEHEREVVSGDVLLMGQQVFRVNF